MSYELRYGKSNCRWASCREGCTAQIYKCHQIRVTYTPRKLYRNNTSVEDIADNEWAYLTRREKLTDAEDKPLLDENGEVQEHVVEDTPLLINIKGCGYPPEVNCDIYAELYQNYSLVSKTSNMFLTLIMIQIFMKTSVISGRCYISMLFLEEESLDSSVRV